MLESLLRNRIASLVGRTSGVSYVRLPEECACCGAPLKLGYVGIRGVRVCFKRECRLWLTGKINQEEASWQSKAPPF